MALFISVAGLSGLAAFALLGLAVDACHLMAKALRTPIYFARRQYMWKTA